MWTTRPPRSGAHWPTRRRLDASGRSRHRCRSTSRAVSHSSCTGPSRPSAILRFLQRFGPILRLHLAARCRCRCRCRCRLGALGGSTASECLLDDRSQCEHSSALRSHSASIAMVTSCVCSLRRSRDRTAMGLYGRRSACHPHRAHARTHTKHTWRSPPASSTLALGVAAQLAMQLDTHVTRL